MNIMRVRLWQYEDYFYVLPYTDENAFEISYLHA
jgi:hypothetical protein